MKYFYIYETFKIIFTLIYNNLQMLNRLRP